MTVIKGVYVPYDEEQALEVVEIHQGNIKAIQHYVGGYFEVVPLEDPEASVFCDEEGKVNGRLLNRRATLVWWTYWPAARNVDILAGDVLILGGVDGEGNTLGCPDELIDLLVTNPGPFKYQVQVTGEDGWHSNQRVLEDRFDAFNDALALAERWLKVERTRVVPVLPSEVDAA